MSRNRRTSETATFVGKEQGFSFTLDEPSPNELHVPTITSPLLPTHGAPASKGWISEIYETWCLAWSVIASYILQIFPGMVNVVFLGHLGVEALGASTLATMFINVTGLSLGLGLATAMDTLCSQAYGANNKKMLGVILQRGILILTLTSLPI
eukprot:Sdes_comp9969_c0_seq1m1532